MAPFGLRRWYGEVLQYAMEHAVSGQVVADTFMAPSRPEP